MENKLNTIIDKDNRVSVPARTATDTTTGENNVPTLTERGEQLRTLIDRNFPGLWHSVDLGLATCATLLLKDNVNPVAVIYVGPPSSSKTTVAEMFADAKVNGKELCYVSDDFTPASFVSQAANISTEALEKVDLLPRIRHKVLVTPELAPIFRGKEDELVKMFRILTRVLDGEGLSRDGGVHGQRRVRGDYLFAWLGCTTPLEKKVWKVMAQLGSRLFFLVLQHDQEVGLDELINPLNPIPYAKRRAECRQAVHEFIACLFDEHGGVRGVEWDGPADETPIKKWIGRCAMLLAKMRSEPARVKASNNGEEEYQPGSEEVPYRAYAVLYNLARGHALVHGRTHLAWEDLPLIAEVTLSTMPPQYGQVFRVLVDKADHTLTSSEVQRALQVSSPNTAKNTMEHLEKLGIMEYIQPGKGQTSSLKFDEDWAWCASTDFREILLGGVPTC